MFNLLISKFKLKHLLGGLALLAGLIWLAVFSFPDQKLHLIFCDVGQGDAILIQKGFNQILIDGGPNNKVLDCLSKNMPFWDRTIEIVALTHPQADHLGGLNYVLERYSVNYFLSGPEGNESAGYKQLIAKIVKKQSSSNNPLTFSNDPLAKSITGIRSTTSTTGIKVINPYTGQKIKFAGMELETLWPEKNWVANSILEAVAYSGDRYGGTILNSNDQPSSNDPLTSSNYPLNLDGAILGASTTHDLNDFSLVFLLKYGQFQALFPGDADAGIQDEILLTNTTLKRIDILKVPHHGAKTSLRDDFLEKVNPKIAIISVGKNSYGHPSKEVIEKLSNLGIKIRRTDLEGEIRFKF